MSSVLSSNFKDVKETHRRWNEVVFQGPLLHKVFCPRIFVSAVKGQLACAAVSGASAGVDELLGMEG